ncbi:MAG: hypothetical protein U5M23_05790 [Marinagarivorans sp.]|nr:hypothetical protein [Marinagarivorans sp.]
MIRLCAENAGANFCGYDSTLTNVRLVQLASGQNETAQLPQGVTLTYNAIASIGPNAGANITFNFRW